MGYWGISRHRSVAVWLALGFLTTGCALSDGDSDNVATTGSDKATSSDVAMPSGTYTGNWPDNPSEFANNPLATGSFDVITVEVSGDNWTIDTSYSTTVPVGGNCFSTGTSTISGAGTIFVDAGGPELIAEVTNQWVRERSGDGCTPWSDEGEELVTIALTYEDGSLVGWIEGHNITLAGN